MKKSQLRKRYRTLIWFFARITLGFIFWDVILVRIGFRKLARKTRSNRLTNLAVQFRAMAIVMGGVMIKVGQFLSSRLDVLPPEITDALSGLQDEVPPESFEDIRKLAEEDLGAALEVIFEDFKETPLAAASLGQVHQAKLCKEIGEGGFCDVVVKVQRPGIDQLIEVDLSVLARVGNWLMKYEPIAKRADVPSLLKEFAETIRAEVNYLAEGKNAETFAENFKDVPRVHVPRVVWKHTTKRVLTLEDVLAIKITDYEAITEAGIDRSLVATELLDVYLKQIFEDGFFHADPHPGNLFITPLDTKNEDGKTDWKLTFVDFGMVGSVPDVLRSGLREMLISVGTQDAPRLIRSYQTLDLLLPSADIHLMERATSQVFGMFWGKSMSELREIDHAEMFRFADQFRDLLFDMPFQLPQNLLLLVRTIAILSGMCSGLSNEFNLWEQLTPYASTLIAKEGGANWQQWLGELVDQLKVLLALPGRTNRVLDMLEHGELIVQTPSIERRFRSLEKSVNRLSGSIFFLALFMGGIVLLVSGEEMLATISLSASGLILLWILLGSRGNSRRFHP